MIMSAAVRMQHMDLHEAANDNFSEAEAAQWEAWAASKAGMGSSWDGVRFAASLMAQKNREAVRKHEAMHDLFHHMKK